MWVMPPEIRTTFHALMGRTRGRKSLAALVFSAAEFFINIFSDVWMKQSENPKHFQRKKKVSGIEKI